MMEEFAPHQVEFAGLRDKASAAKSRVADRVSQARADHPRFDRLSSTLESARDEFRLHGASASAKAADRLDELKGQLRETRVGQKLSDWKTRLQESLKRDKAE